MVHAKNYESASTFVKVIPRKLLASFFLDTVYFYAENKTHLSSVLSSLRELLHLCHYYRYIQNI